MKVTYNFDGARFRTSKSGKPYAELYLREYLENGEVSFQQQVFRCFNEQAVEKCREIEKNSAVVIEMTVRDAVIEGISTELL